MNERIALAKTVLKELRTIKEQPPYIPAADVDMVWVLSSPGTVKTISHDGIYAGISTDKKVVEAGIELVKKITAIRTGKNTSEVTKSEIEEKGPVFFYNGESARTKNVNYLQNEHLEDLVSTPEFPLPKSHVIIDEINEIGTPAQVKGIAQYLDKNPQIRKIVVVSMGHHSRRVARYLQHYLHLFSPEIIFENAPVLEVDKPVGKTLREIKKIIKYFFLGNLSKEPYF